MLIDTHCHIHDLDYPVKWDEMYAKARKNDVKKFICIGTDVENSKEAISYSKMHKQCFASVGVHPSNCQLGIDGLEEILQSGDPKIVAIGEIGLDYHYGLKNRKKQIEILKKQLILANKYNLPVIFHVREAFDDFWKVIEEFETAGVSFQAVLHSFTDNEVNLKRAIDRGFMIGVNGFSTFTKDDLQKDLYRNIPLTNLILETDAPYLTPKPFRGKVNEPAYVMEIAGFIASARGFLVEDIKSHTTTNARKLFNI